MRGWKLPTPTFRHDHATSKIHQNEVATSGDVAVACQAI
jgi:hypothetical protein